MAKFHPVSRKRSSLGSFTFHACLPLTLCLVSAAPSVAQVYQRAAPLNVSPSLMGDSSYGIDTSTTCPSPRFSVGGFVGTGNDRATLNDPYLYNSSSINQYGVTAGISVPFGSGLSGFCEDWAKGRLERQRIDNENSRRNAQLALIEQCYWLKTNGFLTDENLEKFGGTPEFESLSSCFKIDLTRSNASVINPAPLPSPPKAETSPEPAPPLIIQDNRR